jgi:hypothetical protein
MAGEMAIDPETGKDDQGNVWNLHLAVAKDLGGELRAFDHYQGPYVLFHGRKIWIQAENDLELRVAIERVGNVGPCPHVSEPFMAHDDEEMVIDMVRSMLPDIAG